MSYEELIATPSLCMCDVQATVVYVSDSAGQLPGATFHLPGEVNLIGLHYHLYSSSIYLYGNGVSQVVCELADKGHWLKCCYQ